MRWIIVVQSSTQTIPTRSGRGATFFERYLRNTRTKGEPIILAYPSKDSLAWLQLYAYVCARSGRMLSGQLPGAASPKALVNAERNTDKRIKEMLKRHNDTALDGVCIREWSKGRTSCSVEIRAQVNQVGREGREVDQPHHESQQAQTDRPASGHIWASLCDCFIQKHNA